MNFDFLFNLFGSLLSLLYDLHPSYAFMIIGLTLVVMIIVTPLTLKATRSMLMMQQLQPEMKKIQSRYKDDRQKLNEELLKFYKENNINPVGGCLPLLIQMPVFIVLYNVLRGLTLRVPTLGANIGSLVGQQSAGGGLNKPPTLLHNFDPLYVPRDSNLFHSLTATNEMRSWGLSLADSLTDVLSRDGILHALPYILLVIIVGITGFVQQRQIQGRNTGAAINPQQQQIMKIMPIFLPLFSLGLPSGLVLYFAVSNLYRVGQQGFISRSIYGPHNAAQAKVKASDGDAVSKSGGGSDGGGPRPGIGPKSGGGSGGAAKNRAVTGRVVEDKSGVAKGRSKAAVKTRGGASAGGSKAAAAAKAKQAAGQGAEPKPERQSRRVTPPATATKDRSKGAGSPPAKKTAESSGRETGAGPSLQPRARKKKR